MKNKIFISGLIIIIVVLLSGIGIILLLDNILFPDSTVLNRDIELNFSNSNAYTFVKNQTEDIGYRIPGTPESQECIEFFISKFQQIDSNFTYVYHNFTVHNTNCCNVLFKMNEGYDNILILGAHFDSRVRATKDSHDRSAPVPGANDGASGCAVLLELARVLYLRRVNLNCEIWFLFFDAEDQGLDNEYGIEGWDWCEGSTKFVNEMGLFYNSSQEIFECMILLDMVGGSNLRFINELYSTSSLLNEIFATGRSLGYINAFPTSPDSNRITDDHISFVSAGISSADLIINFWNNPSWSYHHTTQDDLTHISEDSLEITGKTIEQFIYNNFYAISGTFYRTNYPWNIDHNLIKIDLTDQIILYSLGIGLVGIVFIGFKIKIQKRITERE